MISYSFHFEKFVINEALFDQSLNEYFYQKTNSWPDSNIQYYVTICTNLIQIKPNSLGQTEYRS